MIVHFISDESLVHLSLEENPLILAIPLILRTTRAIGMPDPDLGAIVLCRIPWYGYGVPAGASKREKKDEAALRG